MRTSLQQLHGRLGTTTVYVTHDQVEAMTLGQRVAVMSDGKVQQVDVPQKLYQAPTNLFVAAFIGSPAMNLVEATLDGDAVAFGSTRLPLDREHRPAAAPDGRVVLGLRPEAFEDAAFSSEGLPQIEAKVEVLEELGADAYVFFDASATTVTVEGTRADSKEDETTLLAGASESLLSARVDPRTKARVGDTIRLSVDPSRLYFFSPESGESLLAA
jgi:multiple sugar transport system ATP-binding protein